jgi:hypothetical protein
MNIHWWKIEVKMTRWQNTNMLANQFCKNAGVVTQVFFNWPSSDCLFSIHLFLFVSTLSMFRIIIIDIESRFQQYFSYILVVSHIGWGNGELVHRENHWSFTSNTNWQSLYHIELYQIYFTRDRNWQTIVVIGTDW